MVSLTVIVQNELVNSLPPQGSRLADSTVWPIFAEYPADEAAYTGARFVEQPV
jgi:hypothetical protein